MRGSGPSSNALEADGLLRGAGWRLRGWVRRVALGVAFATGFGACAAAEANAFTLRLTFPDGAPMTYGSACYGSGCLQRGDGIATTDERGEIVLTGGLRAIGEIGEIDLSAAARTIEYRRDGVRLGLAPIGVVSGTVAAIGDRVTVVLPRILVGSNAAVDTVESDLVARLNEIRAAEGLPLAQINPKLSAAADLQATYLTQTGVTFAEPGAFHEGPFESDMAFRHGEVSLPNPAEGGEIAEAGGTVDEAISDWMSSAAHREQILARGRVMIGAAKVGAFTIVQTHRRCDGCVAAGTGTRAGAAPAPGPAAPPPLAATLAPAAPTVGASQVAPARQPSCRRETIATRRLQSRGGRIRLSISARCLKPRARYLLLIRQGASGRLLRTMRITRAGTRFVALRPARSARKLQIRLKRDGRAVISRTMSLRT